MKRIEFILSGKKGETKDALTFRENKIRRAIERCIDYTKEKASTLEYEAMELINSISDVSDDEDGITTKLNRYIEKKEECEGYKRSTKYLKELEKSINDEIEVEVCDNGKTVITD